jgi:hypothetical protein
MFILVYVIIITYNPVYIWPSEVYEVASILRTKLRRLVKEVLATFRNKSSLQISQVKPLYRNVSQLNTVLNIKSHFLCGSRI